VKKWIAVLGTLAALAAFAYSAGQRRAAEQVSRPRHGIPVVTVVRPQRRDLARQVTLTGDLLGIRQVDLTAKVPGFIKRIYVDRGDHVKTDQMLAVLTYPEQEKAYRQAKANFELAEANYDRYRRLLDEHVISRQDYDTALANYKSTRETYREQEELYNYRFIRAPFPGYIIQRNYDPGHLVFPGMSQSPLFVLADSSKARIFVYVPEEDVGRLKLGSRAEVKTDAYPEKTFFGEVTRIAQGLDPTTRTMQTEIDLVNPENLLKPGMFARVVLNLFNEYDVLTLVPAAVIHGDQGSFVYTVRDGHAHKTAVKTGLEESDAVQIVSGLSGDEEVVVSGAELLDDGSPLKVAAVLNEASPGNAQAFGQSPATASDPPLAGAPLPATARAVSAAAHRAGERAETRSEKSHAASAGIHGRAGKARAAADRPLSSGPGWDAGVDSTAPANAPHRSPDS
jgi:membrane fusion protein (multidrug efflux system)